MIDKLIEKYGTILNTLRENKKIADSTDFYPYNIDIKNTREYLKDLKALKKQLTIPVVIESCTINGKGLCEYSDKLGFCPRCDTDAYSR